MTVLKVWVGKFVQFCAILFLFFLEIIKKSYRQILHFFNWLTNFSPSQLAPSFFWITVLANLFKLLFGNSFSLAGWANALDEPSGYVIYTIIPFLGLILLVAAIRSSSAAVSPKWERIHLIGTIILIPTSLLVWNLSFSLQSHFSKDSNGAATAARPVNHTVGTDMPDKTTKSLVLAETDLTGNQGPSIKFLDLHPNQKIQIEVLRNDLRSVDKSGGWHNLTPWGYEDPKIASCQDDWWNAVIPYSHVSGVKCGEVVVLLREKPMQFPDGKKSMIVENSSSTGSASVVLYINNPKEYWWDSQCESKYIFPTRSEAKKYGCLDAQRYDAFVPGSYTGAMHFRATTVN